MKKLFLLVLLLLLLLVVGFYFTLNSHESYSEQKVEFLINKPYLATVKELATKESLEKTIEENNGRLYGKNWDIFVVELPKKILRIKEYRLQGKLSFFVEKQDADLGKIVLPFEQDISVDKDVFNINTKLKAPQESVLIYNKFVEIIPYAESGLETKTHVIIKSELKIKKIIPNFFNKVMDEKVDAANKVDLEQLKSNLKKITETSSPVIHFKLKND
jgi:hypothetical protein